MRTPSKVEMTYRLAIGAFLLVLGLAADVSGGTRFFLFLISALAFVEAYLRAIGKDPFSRGAIEGTDEHPTHIR
jgi:hypothetical protein